MLTTAPELLVDHLADADWRGEVVYVVGSGPSKAAVDLADLDRRAGAGEVRVIAVNTEARGLPHANLAFSKDEAIDRFWSSLDARHPQQVFASSNASRGVPEGAWFVREQQRRPGCGGNGTWPTSLAQGLVTSGNSGLGAICLADLLLGGEGTILLVGFDLDGEYTCFRPRFEEFRSAIRARCLVVGPSAMDARWERAIER